MAVKFTVLIATALCLTACRSRSPVSDISASDAQSFVPGRPQKLEMCAAVRGNGNYIFAHWGALARILENYGPIDGLAGGSSGSATAFLYESVYMNPAVWDCRPYGGRCAERQAALRMAFLMKSMREFVNVIGDRVDFNVATEVGIRLVKRFQAKEYVRAIASGDLYTAAVEAHKILTSAELKGIIDTKVISRLEHALKNKTELKVVMTELKGVLAGLDWKTDNANILIQRGLIDFNELTKRVGIAGDFYSGKDPQTVQEMKRMLDSCAQDHPGSGMESSVNKQWRVVAELPGPQSLVKPEGWFAGKDMLVQKPTCGAFFKATANGFFDRFIKANKEPQRLNDTVGKYIPAVASTSIFNTAEADNHLRHIYLLFLNDKPYQRGFKSNWIQFGYWGQPQDLARIQENQNNFTDIKTSRFLPLGEGQWGEVLRVGPQEPGLGSVLCNYEAGSATHRGKWDSLSNLWNPVTASSTPPPTCHKWSLGGWSDMHPIQILKNMGCEKVVYATKRGEESNFIRGVVKLLTNDDQDWDQMDREFFDLDVPDSSLNQALGMADSVLCTDWNSPGPTQLDCLEEDAYRAPLLTKDDFFLNLKGERGERLSKAGFKPYFRATSGTAIRGCSANMPFNKNAVKSDPCAPNLDKTP